MSQLDWGQIDESIVWSIMVAVVARFFESQKRFPTLNQTLLGPVTHLRVVS